MTKVWEEQWDAEGPYLHNVGTRRRIIDMTNDVRISHDDPEMIAVARLAAAAPELARALLAVEFAAHDPDIGPCCPACGGIDPSFEKGRPEDDHRPDCALDAALRKAGVRA